MKPYYLAITLSLVAMCSQSFADNTRSTRGEIITNITATPTQGGGASFDGVVNEKSDLDELVKTAWGVGWLGLHRGHSPVKNVLKAFLGINHDEMHVYMEQKELNLAKTCEELGFDPDKLIESLTFSFVPFIEEGVEQGVIKTDEVAAWQEKIREAFRKRVYWEG